LPCGSRRYWRQGGTSFVVLPRLKPGEYEFIDEFHMDTGKMTVVAR
jgi:hypothetical protein